MSKYQEIKKELKSLAKNIKNTKAEYKECQRHNSLKLNTIHDLNNYRYQFRHKHIAISLIRGRTRDQIERPGKDNLPNESYIKELLEQYEQTLCSDS